LAISTTNNLTLVSMSRTIKVGVAQCHTLSTTEETLASIESFARQAARRDAGLVLFPEALLGGYPRNCTFGTSIGARESNGREQFLSYYNDAIDLGDTVVGAGDAWAKRTLPIPSGAERRGDGSREELERISSETGVFLVVGVIEKCAGSLFCSAVFVHPKDGMLANKRRKVMPTGSERLVWTQGSTETLKAVSTTIKGVTVTLGSAICWENYMPLLRYSLYAQNVDIWLAPTADGRDNWLSLMRTIASEGRNFVLSCNQVTQRSDLPSWVQSTVPETPHPVKNTSVSGKRSGRRLSRVHTEDGHEICWPDKHQQHENGIHHHEDQTPSRGQSPTQMRKLSIVKTESGHELCLPVFEEDEATSVDNHPLSVDSHGSGATSPSLPKFSSTNGTHNSIEKSGETKDFLSRGGSCIVSPLGEVMTGPVWESEGLQITEINLDDCIRGKLDFDVAGHYSRSDSFNLTVKGLELTPP
jgi:nitrilase